MGFGLIWKPVHVHGDGLILNLFSRHVALISIHGSSHRNLVRFHKRTPEDSVKCVLFMLQCAPHNWKYRDGMTIKYVWNTSLCKRVGRSAPCSPVQIGSLTHF